MPVPLAMGRWTHRCTGGVCADYSQFDAPSPGACWVFSIPLGPALCPRGLALWTGWPGPSCSCDFCWAWAVGEGFGVAPTPAVAPVWTPPPTVLSPAPSTLQVEESG